MILWIERYKVPSGGSQQKGRNDRAWLQAENGAEEGALRKREMAGLPTKLVGSSAMDRDLDALRLFGKSIDPQLKEKGQTIQNGRATKW